MSESEKVISLAVKPKSDPNTDPLLGAEFGSSPVIPGTAWGDFIGTNNGGGEVNNNPNALPIDSLVEMRRKDGQARALMRLMTLPIRNCLKDAEWIAPDRDGDAEDEKEDYGKEEVDFANAMWSLPPRAGGMSTPVSKVLKQILLAIIEGFAVFEEVRYVPTDGPLKGKIVMRKMAYRDSRTIRFRVDDKGGFDGVRQITSAGVKPVDVVIPADKTWYYAANEEENPFYGVSYFESAFEHYTIKRKLYYIAHLAAQFAAVPGRIGEIPAGATSNQVQAFQKALADFAFNTSMTHPVGWKVTNFNGNSGFDFIKLVDHHNLMMAKSVLAGFADNESRMVLIDNGGTDASADLFVQSLEAIMQEIAESWSTHLMPKYIDWNFTSKIYPVFRFGQLTDSAKDAVKEVFTAVVSSSVLNCTPEFVREMEKKLASRLGLDIDYEEIETREQEAAELAQEQAQQEADEQAQALADGQMGQVAGGPAGGPGDPAAGAPGGGPGGPAGGGPAGPPQQLKVAASATSSIDSLVKMAEELLLTRPEG